MVATKSTKHLTVREIASRISAHLKRFEADKAINTMDRPNGCSLYYGAGAFQSGRYVGVRYISYQGVQYLPKADAAEYLAWLEGGNVGKHHILVHAKAKAEGRT